MPQEDEELVVPGRERDREVADPAAVPDRDAVHEQRARTYGADPEPSGGRRPVQPEFSREGHSRGLSEASLGGVTDPPGSGERVGETGSRGHCDAHENEKRGGVRKEAVWRSPRGGR